MIHPAGSMDWSLPQGKARGGRGGWIDAALREVKGGNGLPGRGEAGPELPPVSYLDRKGRSKLVRYWLMEPIGGGGSSPHGEVDELRWLTRKEA